MAVDMTQEQITAQIIGTLKQFFTERLDRVENKVDDVNTKVDGLKDDINTSKIEEAKTHVKQEAQLQQHEKKINDHEKKISEFSKLVPFIQGWMWLAAILGASVVALIWSLITGQAVLVIK